MTLAKVKLGELCRIEKGKTGIQKAIPGKYPLVVTGEERKSHNEYQFDDEAVIVPLVSATGHGHASIKRIHFQRGKFALGTILCALIPNDKQQLSAEYLFRYLELNKDKELVSRMRGMANVTLPMKEISEIEIPLPSLQRQNEFVEKFKSTETTSSALSEELQGQRNIVHKLRLQLLEEAVQGKLINQVNGSKLSSAEIIKAIKTEKEVLVKQKKIKKDKELSPINESDIPFEIPSTWSWCRLGEIALGFKYGTSKHCDYRASRNSKVLRIPNVSSGEINVEDLKFADLPEKERSELALLEDDLLIIRSNGSRDLVGRMVLVGSSFVGYAYAGYLVRLRFNTNFINPRYLWYATQAPYFRNLIEEPLRTTVGINNINTEELSNLLVPIPSHEDQKQIADKLDLAIEKLSQLNKNISEAQSINETLLQEVLRESLR